MRYRLIQQAVAHSREHLQVDALCRIAGVSLSGYYAWQNRAKARVEREKRDHRDFMLIQEAYQYRGYDKGVRGIHMRLLHMGVLMNVKKIRRLMRKYGLYCKIRKANPYRRLAKAIATSHVADNLVKRQFHRGPRKVLLTDITYLFYHGGKCYLSTILDACTHEILAFQVSSDLKVGFVLKTVDKLLAAHGATLDNETIVHSDQGCHYTSQAFIQRLKDASFSQSMSRRGNCWDNAPQESFFGHMKDEIADAVQACRSFEEVRELVADWMDYYNNDRGQWSLQKLTPSEYNTYLRTHVYPLPTWQGV